MAILDITPNFQVPGQDATLTHVIVTTQLEGSTWRFEYKTNRADDLWYLDLYAFDGSILLLGVGLAVGVDILYPYRYLPVPPGKLFVSPQSTTEGYVDPTINSFIAGTHSIYYEESGT